jgi:hypothetical protein
MTMHMVLMVVAILLLGGSALWGPNAIWGGSIIGFVFSVIFSIWKQHLPLAFAWEGIAFGAIVGLFVEMFYIYSARKEG